MAWLSRAWQVAAETVMELTTSEVEAERWRIREAAPCDVVFATTGRPQLTSKTPRAKDMVAGFIEPGTHA